MNRLRVFTFLLLAAACKEPEDPICKECGSDVKYVSTFSNYYFRYITYPDGPRLVRLDSTTNLSTPYKTCYFEGINDLEESKIIRATGGFTESCFGKENPLQVERFEVIDTCMPSIPTIDKNFGLMDTKWNVESVMVDGVTYTPPCEGELSSIKFNNNSNKTFQLYTSINAIYGQYSFPQINTIKLSDDFSFTLRFGTKSQQVFESALLLVIARGATLDYSISRNKLTIVKQGTTYNIKLYTQ